VAKYTTVSNMMILLPDVHSRTNANSAQLSHFINMAEGRVDAYLGRRYALPLSSVPSLVETLSTQVSVYEFLSKRVFAGQVAAESFWVQSYKDALKDLADISNGKMELVTDSGSVISDNNSTPWSSQQNYLPTFTEDDPLAQIIDEDKLDDIESDRGFADARVRLTP